MAFDTSDFEPDTKPSVGKTAVNNPGGLRPVGKSTGFMQFPDAQAGRAALEADLLAKGKRGIKDVKTLVSAWAPPTENDTNAYIDHVRKHVGSDNIDLTDPVMRKKVADAIQIREGVVPLPKTTQKFTAHDFEPDTAPAPAAKVAAQPTKSTPTNTPNDWTGSATTFLKNAAESGTFGLTKPLSALGVMATRALTGEGGKDNTFSNAYNTVDEINAADNTAHPIAAFGGQVAGAVANTVATGGLGGVTRAGKVATQVGINTLGSATQEALTNKDATLGSVGTAAAVGGGSAAAGEVIGAAGRWINGKWVKSAVEDANAAIKKSNAGRAAKDTVAINEAKATNAEIKAANAAADNAPITMGGHVLDPNNPAEAKLIQKIKESQGIKQTPIIPEVPIPGRRPSQVPYSPETFRTTLEGGGKIPGQSFTESVQAAKEQIKRRGLGAVEGALGAGTYGLLSGDPGQGLDYERAAIFGAAGAAGGAATRDLVQRTLTRNPSILNRAFPGAFAVTGKTVAPYITNAEYMGNAPTKSFDTSDFEPE